MINLDVFKTALLNPKSNKLARKYRAEIVDKMKQISRGLSRGFESASSGELEYYTIMELIDGYINTRLYRGKSHVESLSHIQRSSSVEWRSGMTVDGIGDTFDRAVNELTGN